jgi:hypothetical protein
MKPQNVTVTEWVSMLREIGLDQQRMEQWHRIFEACHATGHQSFLEWLGLEPERIAEIRAKSR